MTIQTIEKSLTIAAALAAIISATIMMTQAFNNTAQAQPTVIPCVLTD